MIRTLKNSILFKTVFRGFTIILFVALIFSAGSAAQTTDSPDPQTLFPGLPISREIVGGQLHAYKIPLAANQFLFLTVEQKSADVSLTLFDPENQMLVETNAPNGLEILVFAAEMGGDYRLEINVPNKNALAGFYEVKIAEQRGANPSDKKQIAAAISTNEAHKLFTQFNPENLPRIIEMREQALQDWRTGGNQTGEAAALGYLGLALAAAGEPRKALEYFSNALALWQKLGIASEIAVAHSLLCQTNLRLNRLQDALGHGESALILFRANSDKNGETEMLMLLGNFYSNVGETASALDHYNLALQNWRTLKNQHRAAATLNNIGLVYADSGDAQKAFEFYNQSLQTFRADRPNTRGEANVLNQLGFYFLEKGDLKNALEHFNQAVPIWKRITDAFGEPAALLGIGRVYEKNGDTIQAVETLNQSLALARKRGSTSVEASALFALARIERGRGDLPAAKINIENAISIIEATRASILSRQFRAGYFARTQNLYEFYIDLLVQMNENAAAWQTAERARARSLIELLAESNADIRQGVDTALLERENDLQQKINAAEQTRFQMVLQKRPTEQVESSEANLRRLLNELNLLQTEIRRQSPRYAALTQPQIQNLPEMQKQILDADTLLLEYVLGGERSFLFVMSRTELKTFILPGRNEIETAARNFHEKVKVATSAAEAENAARKLSKIILEPAAAEIGEKRLLIVADGALQFVPFASLKIQSSKLEVQSEENQANKDQRPKTEDRFLIETNEIIMLPSAATLAVLRRETGNRKLAPKTVAVIADPVFNRDDLRITPTINTSLPGENSKLWQKTYLQAAENVGGHLPRLPGSRREALAILALTKPAESRRSLGFEANRAAVVNADLSQYRYIHFATHGLLDSRQPELTGIVLSLFDKNGLAQDGFLRLHEIYNLKLPVELVVLSACETGLGKEIRGEGVIGLTRGFMYAGAKRVVVSLWKVDDRATSELMQRFYRELLSERRPSPAAALRAAQISLLQEKRWQSPFYWSAFTLQGEWR